MIFGVTDLKEQAAIQPQKIQGIKVINSASLDEITNKVFKELLHEKGDNKYKSGSDRGSVKVIILFVYET